MHRGKGYSLWPRPAGLRIAVVGGGCSGFSYSMTFENSRGMLDQTYNSDGFEVLSGKYMSISRDIRWATGSYVFFLKAQGRVLANANILCPEDQWLLDTEPEILERIHAALHPNFL